MLRKSKNLDNKPYIRMYKNCPDTRDIVNCYFNALNQMKSCSYTGQCNYNYIDMYSDLSSLQYNPNEININQYE